MHCPNLGFISLLSRFRIIVFDHIANVSWIHVLCVKGGHNSIQEKYCVIVVKQIYITIAQDFC